MVVGNVQELQELGRASLMTTNVLDALPRGRTVRMHYYGDTVRATVDGRYPDGSVAMCTTDGGSIDRVFVYPADITRGTVRIDA